ncbi:MAG: efflux RND transporter periplasmic adaptor subunit [bacterium]
MNSTISRDPRFARVPAPSGRTMHGSLARAAATALAVVALFASCARHAEESPAADTREPRDVKTARVSQPDDVALAVLAGRVEAREEVSVAAKIPARLSRLAFSEGESFRRGDLLAEFAGAETREAVNAARAASDAAAQRLDVARRQEARIDSLFAARIATRRELENAQSARKAADADLAGAKAALAAWVANAELRAPFDGVVVRRRVDAGADVSPGQPLLDIRSLDAGRIVAAIPESMLDLLPSARVAYQLGDGAWRDARLDRVDGMTSSATRSRDARFAPLDDAAPLEPGAFARVRLSHANGAQLGEQPANVPSNDLANNENARSAAALSPAYASGVPTSSLVVRGGLRGVFVVRDGRAWLRWIRAGRDEGGITQVLAGLDAGEEFVLTPEGLTDGAPVRVTP